MPRELRTTFLLLLLCVGGSPGCHHPTPAPQPPAAAPVFVTETTAPDVLIVVETEGPTGPAARASASALQQLIAHFDETCDTVAASEYSAGTFGEYSYGFYVAGRADSTARERFARDAASHQGTVVWIGDGIGDLGAPVLDALRLRHEAADGAGPAHDEWTIAYGGQRHKTTASVPPLAADEPNLVLAEASYGSVRRPFIVGKERLWYAATGPRLGWGHFWVGAVWADALHEIMGRPHEGRPRLLIPVLRDVPVWTTPRQVPTVIRPMLEADIPVGVLACTNWGDVPLADRPDAARGLREAESMGAAVALVSDTHLDAREHFRLAWEVQLHPVAWAGPTDADNPFRLQIREPEDSPPFAAGGKLPAPIAISDAGYIDPGDAARIEMQQVVRDAVALVSFGLWAPASPFQEFVERQEARGWRVADLRELAARVDDPRRTLASCETTVRVAPGARLRRLVFGPDWQPTHEEILAKSSIGTGDIALIAPERSMAMLEAIREKPDREFVKGVTLDPWAYAGSFASAEILAETLAERYLLHGVNTVFFYAYNVEAGAAYRTRYRGASVSDWGRSDLLAHMLEACHARGIRVVAWLYSGRDKGMWNKHPEWRERTRAGRDYNPLRLHAAHFLCPRNPDVRSWYSGLLRDLARRYPTLDGIELCEPVVNWFGSHACHCELCSKAFARECPGERLGGTAWRKFRADGLTEFLSECLRAIRESNIDSYVMTINDALDNGAILSPRRQAEESGFDLDALLDGPYPPDWVNFEIIWQQWAAISGTKTFNYDWAAETAHRLVRRTDGRARVLLHVELTDFGRQRMTPARIAETIRRLKAVNPDGMECYHSAAIDEKRAWRVLNEAYEGLP